VLISQQSLLAILVEELVRLPPFLRILITSRTESDMDILSTLKANPHVLAQALDIVFQKSHVDNLRPEPISLIF
jgi:hypothetical protein